MTFYDRYASEDTWHGRAMIMEIYHLAQSRRNKTWTIRNTADYFEVSMGLVSENLRLAQSIHAKPELIKLPTRQDALRKL